MPFVLVWMGENAENEGSTENENVSFSHTVASVDGRKRFENASVDAEICIRFRWIKNGGIRKRISVDVA